MRPSKRRAARRNHGEAALRIALLTLAMCLAAACSCQGKSGDKPATNAGVNAGEPKRGGVLTIAAPYVSFGFDPVRYTTPRGVWTMVQIYDQLIRPNRDGTGVEAGLASSWETSADARTYTFHLRPDLRFADGSPLRGSDVKFSLERLRGDPVSDLKSYFFVPFNVATPDDRTVIVTFEKPWVTALGDLALFWASILPQARIEQSGLESFMAQPIGSGPFVLAEWKRGERIVLRRNPHYWDAAYPYLEEIRWLAMPDEMTRMLKLQAGEVDLVEDTPPSQVELLRSAQDVDAQVAPTMRVDLLCLNTRSPAMQDILVRRAIDSAIDREAIIKTVLLGHGDVARSILPRGPYVDSEPPYVHDIAKARRLIAESSHPDGVSARLLVTPDPLRQQVAVMLKSQLEPIGIRVEIRQLEGALYGRAKTDGEFEMILDGTTNDIFDPTGLLEWFVMPPSPFPRDIGYNNPEVHALVRLGRTEIDPLRRTQELHEVQRKIRDDAVLLGLYWRHAVTGLRRGVHGFAVLPTTNYRLWEVWKSP